MQDRQNRVKTTFSDPHKTNQKWKKSADIKEIVRKNRVARLQQNNPYLVQQRLDVIETFDTGQTYQDQMNQVRNVTNEFNSLPADVQKRFNFDPAQLIDFVRDPKNDKEAVKMGLKYQDLSAIKYERTDENNNTIDITDEVYKKRGLYIDGVRVDRKGQPLLLAQNGDLVERDGTVVQTKAEREAQA